MTLSAQDTCVFRFDNFELDTQAGELRKRGQKLGLQGQPLQVLATLLKRPSELVTRDELRREIWPADTFVDFDHNLHNAIARLRDVLGDSPQTPRYIETLPRRGYRFIGKLEERRAGEQASAEENQINRDVSSGGWQAHKLLATGLMIVLLSAVAAALWGRAWHTRSAKAPLPLHSIAVLPLENLSGNASQEYFVDGMTEELITDLAKISSLRVISRTSVMRYKATRKGLPEIARELNVEGIVEGSVLRSGKRIRITAQLLHGPTDQHLWAEAYERDLGDVLTLQSEVAQAIAQQVRAQVTPRQEAELRSARTVNPEAYDAYLRGRFYLTNEFSHGRALKTAQHYFEQSIAKDPGFALAYAGLADTYTYLALFRQLAPDTAYRSARDAIHKVLQLDSSIGQVHDTLALLNWRFERNWQAAEQEFEQAIEHAPNYSCAHEDHAEYLSLRGQRTQSLAELAKSMEMDASPSAALTEAGVHYQLRDFNGLIESSRRGLMSYPNEWLEHYYLAVGYEGTGKPQEAISEYQKAVAMSGGDQDAVAALAHAYAISGRGREAQRMVADLERKAKSTYVSSYLIATIYAGLGNRDKAFAFLQKAYEERSLEVTWFLKADLRIDNLRSDPRFQALWQRVGFPA